jgi:hypothetical protein
MKRISNVRNVLDAIPNSRLDFTPDRDFVGDQPGVRAETIFAGDQPYDPSSHTS